MAVAVAEVMVGVASRRTDEGIRMGEEIETIRKAGPYTQQQVADRLGMTLQGYLGYRRGYQRVTANTIKRWATALEVSIPELAQRLGIELLGEADSSGLRQQLAGILPDADAAELDDLTRRLSTLPPSDRRQILEMWRDHLDGRPAWGCKEKPRTITGPGLLRGRIGRWWDLNPRQRVRKSVAAALPD